MKTRNKERTKKHIAVCYSCLCSSATASSIADISTEGTEVDN